MGVACPAPVYDGVTKRVENQVANGRRERKTGAGTYDEGSGCQARFGERPGVEDSVI